MAENVETTERHDIEYSKDEEALLDTVLTDWVHSYNQKHMTYHHLGDRTHRQFVEDSRDAVDCYVQPPDDEIDEWQSYSYKPKTRNKAFAQSAILTSAGIGVDITAFDNEKNSDRSVARIADDLYEFSLSQENFDFKQAIALIEQAVTGTVHDFEDIVWEERTVKDVVDVRFDGETETVEYEEVDLVDFKGCRGEIVANEEIYPGDIREPDIQKQPHMFRRRITTKASASSVFSKYKRWEKVQPGRQFFAKSGEDEYTEDDTAFHGANDDSVEILWYWDRPNDVFAVIANGVLLTDADEGFPYPHKRYPFAKGINMPFADFRSYFGNSVANLNKDEQYDTNDLWRMMLDSVKLSLKPPVATDIPELAESDGAVPGAVIPKSEDEFLEVLDAYAKGVGNDAFKMLSLVEQQTDENTVDSMMTGKQPAGDPTAEEIKTVARASERLRNLAEIFLGDLMVQQAHLRIPNALWFAANEEDNEELGYSQIIRDDVELKSGKTGRRKIVFTDFDMIPDARAIKQAEKKAERRGEPTELLFVNRESALDYRFHILVSATAKPRRNSGNRIIRALEKYRVYQADPTIKPTKNSRELVKAFGDNPDEWVTEPQQGNILQPNGGSATNADARMAKALMDTEQM